MILFLDCNPVPDVETSCKNDILTVTWLTDTTYDGRVSEIPTDLYERLTDRLIEESRYPILGLIVTSRFPP